VIDEEVDQKLKEVCLEIEKWYEIKFLEIGTDKEHVFSGTSNTNVQCDRASDDDKKLECTKSL
jgi:hypothetical protein